MKYVHAPGSFLGESKARTCTAACAQTRSALFWTWKSLRVYSGSTNAM